MYAERWAQLAGLLREPVGPGAARPVRPVRLGPRGLAAAVVVVVVSVLAVSPRELAGPRVVPPVVVPPSGAAGSRSRPTVRWGLSLFVAVPGEADSAAPVQRESGGRRVGAHGGGWSPCWMGRRDGGRCCDVG